MPRSSGSEKFAMRLSLRLSFLSMSFNARILVAGRLSGTVTAVLAMVGLVALAATGCARSGATATSNGAINAVGAENEYANVLAQIGGGDWRGPADLDNPDPDPHTCGRPPHRCHHTETA